MIRLEQKVQMTIEKTQAKGDLFSDRLQSHQQMLDSKMAALAHYDNRIAFIDGEIANTRKLAHEFRDSLKKELYEQDRRINLLEEKVDYEIEKVSPATRV